ncbi:sugar lactone lactonase YvrE [Paenibacillus phyllosphaerae]|uniref:Sugar lactone lactonase YvrE n=1 Tax=Paenibacillus phyllosphaerae TaxID=274593 RepID=A0A7W5AU29_9BACL|nr:hypothetical protein [Paenibacillus phyllosphaerae]MBB3108800.1 sugar lactone lactonase YvrE [Paenibacillus phyllosphaerae]
MNAFRKWVAGLTAFALLSVFGSGTVSAATPYEGYTYVKHGGDIHSTNGYLYEDSIDGYDLPTGAFNAPEDLFVADDDSIYIVDSGNSRVIHLDADGNYVGTIGDLEGDGMLNEPKGVFVTHDGMVYVADTKNQRIAIFDQQGKFVQQFGKPESPLLGETFSYSPSKLLVDKRGYMFVVSDGNTQGLIQIDPKGVFRGFYGANHIGFSWVRLFQKLVATEEQRAKIATVKPLEFSNAVLDSEGFIYTTTLGTDRNQLKRLSPVGVDTLPANKVYGDYFVSGDAPFSVPSFVDIVVDNDGIMTAVDLQTSKIFQYDKLGNFLFAFGGLGDQNGLFVQPSSIDQTSKGAIYVVDKGRNRIDIFKATPFAKLVQQASKYYVEGRYAEAEGLWQEVIRQNSHYELAYLAIGKAHYKAENYEDAMRYFKLAYSRADYSAAFKEFRKEFTREHFAMICVGLILLLIALRYVLPLLWRLAKKQWLKREASKALKGGVHGDRNLSSDATGTGTSV